MQTPEDLKQQFHQFKSETVQSYQEMAMEVTIVKGLAEILIGRVAYMEKRIDQRFNLLEAKVDINQATLEAKIDRVQTDLTEKFDALQSSLTEILAKLPVQSAE